MTEVFPAEPVAVRRETARTSPSPAAAPFESPRDIVAERPAQASRDFALEHFGFDNGDGTGVPLSAEPSAVELVPAPPVRQAATPVRVGGLIQPPQKIKDVTPRYPSIAQQARVTGVVILEAVLSEGGAVASVRVLRSVPLLDDAAVEAVSQWRFTPTRLNGVAVPVVMTVTVAFSLP